jgi:hypothetical protein
LINYAVDLFRHQRSSDYLIFSKKDLAIVKSIVSSLKRAFKEIEKLGIEKYRKLVRMTDLYTNLEPKPGEEYRVLEFIECLAHVIDTKHAREMFIHSSYDVAKATVVYFISIAWSEATGFPPDLKRRDADEEYAGESAEYYRIVTSLIGETWSPWEIQRWVKQSQKNFSEEEWDAFLESEGWKAEGFH